MAEEFKFEVFLSYSAKDKTAVHELAARLKRDGLGVWFDEEQIKPGDSIIVKIEEGLQISRSLVLCMSANAFGSDWAGLESGTFRFRDPLNRKRRFIPLRLDNSPIKDSLAQFKCVNWFSDLIPEEREKEYEKLLAACRAEAGSAAKQQRICMISSEYPPNVLGGLGIHVSRLTEELAALADVDLVLPHFKIGYVLPPSRRVQVRDLARVEANYDDPMSWMHFAQHASDLIERLNPKPDVIHCHDWVTVLAGLRCRYRLKIPLVFHVHLPNRTPFCASVENLGLLCADLVTVNSQAMAEQIKDRFPDKKIAVVPNGVDMTLFQPPPTDPAGDGYVLFVGRLVEQKGVDHLLRAFVHVLKRFPDQQLKIVGAGPCDAAYRRLADCLLLGDCVQFLGWKSGGPLRDLYQSAAVVALPGIYEPFGMTALEAMACGRPVVASNTGGLKEIIEHLKTGCLAEPADHLDLAQWIIYLLAHQDLRKQMASQASRAVHGTDIYKWSSIAREYAAFYYKLSCESLDTKVPFEALRYRAQIIDLARRIDQTLPYNFFNTILDWEK